MEGKQDTHTTPDITDPHGSLLKSDEEKLDRFVQQRDQGHLDDRERILNALHQTMAQDVPDKQLTEEDFHEALRLSSKDSAGVALSQVL